jgi:transaldolase/glucose-6-phosphate isomerase
MSVQDVQPASEQDSQAAANRLRQLAEHGQSVWLDFIDRGFLQEGKLKRLIDEDGIVGVTSNPTIFEKAIGHSVAYDDQLAADVRRGVKGALASYEALAFADIRTAADLLAPVYQRRGGADGYVSLEVPPTLAADTHATVEEARRLWAAIDRPNLMVKVPATEAGVPAIRRLIEDGININVTLIFGVERYKEVLEAHLSGLEARANRGHPIDQVAGVASFFVSRIDTVVDQQIDERLARQDPQEPELRALRGRVAIANAKLAYSHYQEISHTSRWQILADKGALPQRLLWASTGTKDTTFSDVVYPDSLIGRDTVNTMPPKTIDAFRDHGTVRPTLGEDVEGAKHVLAEAKRLGLNVEQISVRLVETGIQQFAEAFSALIAAVENKRSSLFNSNP